MLLPLIIILIIVLAMSYAIPSNQKIYDVFDSASLSINNKELNILDKKLFELGLSDKQRNKDIATVISTNEDPSLAYYRIKQVYKPVIHYEYAEDRHVDNAVWFGRDSKQAYLDML